MPSYSTLSVRISVLLALHYKHVCHSICIVSDISVLIVNSYRLSFKLVCLHSYILSNFFAFISEQVSKMFLYICHCFIFSLHYFCIDVKWCISSICIFVVFISHLIIELYSPLFSSGWICCRISSDHLRFCRKQKHFSSRLAQSSVVALEQLLSGRREEYLLAWFSAIVSCHFCKL